MREKSPNEYSIPERMNIGVFLVALPATWLFLWGAKPPPWPWPFVFAFGFSHLHMTLFSLLHEAVHGVFFEILPGTNFLEGFARPFSPHRLLSNGLPTWGITDGTGPKGTFMITSYRTNRKQDEISCSMPEICWVFITGACRSAWWYIS